MSPIILILPFVIAIVFAMTLKNVASVLKSSMAFAAISAISIFAYALPHVFGTQKNWSDNWLLFDGFSALMATLIAIVYLAATFVGVRYIGHEHEEKIVSNKDLRNYFALFHLFALCMVVTVLANNTLLLWLALEGTTLSSTFLVGLYHRKSSMEAAWKYIIICTTGISLGIIGVLLMGYGAHAQGLIGSDIFTISALLANKSLLSAQIVKWAFVFVFVGFGTKVGLVPMHTWLPDAHSKAPSPISGIFSGILLNVALYAIIRFKFITDAALGGSEWTNQLLIFFGFISIILPALMMIIQGNYKRMLAYSSVEHMGLITFALALSPLGAVAAVMHMIGHTLAKSTLFFGAGEILLAKGTTKIEKVRGLMKTNKYTSVLFLLGVLAIVAVPPSALFISEYSMFVSAIQIHPVLSVCIFVALGVIAWSMLKISAEMIFSDAENESEIKKEKWNITHTVMTIELVLLVVVAFWMTTGKGVATITNIVKDAIYPHIN